MEHTQQCIELTKKQDEAQSDYIRKWPSFCRNCFGQGQFFSDYDPSPPGISLGSGYYTEVDLCKSCTEKGLCPRCGAKVWATNDDEIPETPCSQCGWDWSKNEGDAMPEPYVCYCWELAAQLWETEQKDQDYYQRVLRGEE